MTPPPSTSRSTRRHVRRLARHRKWLLIALAIGVLIVFAIGAWIGTDLLSASS
jgi:cell division septal protein FtsQ